MTTSYPNKEKCIRCHDSSFRRSNGRGNKTKCGFCTMFVWDGDVAIDCIIADCKNKAGYRTTLLCHTHQARLRKYGDPMMITRGINGEGHINKLGYKEIWVDGIKKLEHRYVMEQFLDRQLFQHENVHHKNGQRSDNSIDNLELWSTSQPSGQRVEDKIIWAREFLKQYDAKVIL